MFKKIIKFLLILFVLGFCFDVYGEYVICDSGYIDFEGKTVSEICNNGYESLDIISIESFTGSYINFESGSWGNNSSVDKSDNIKGTLPIGYFDFFKETKVENIDPDYSFVTGYIGTFFSYSGELIDIEKDNVIGFFDTNKNTVISAGNIKFSFPVGFMGTHEIKKKSGGGHVQIIKDVTYKEYFREVLYKNIDPIYLTKHSKHELDNFIDALINILDESGKLDLIIQDVTKRRIDLHIQESDFRINLNSLINDFDKINDAFDNSNIDLEKIYILDFYKNTQ